MHPAFSVIFFTVFSGTGYGLLALIGVLVAFGLLPQSTPLGLIGLGLGLVAVSTGLLASTWHLGHPERAWRAFSQWRTSWLSREGVVAVATYVPVLMLTYFWLFDDGSGVVMPVWAVLTAVGAMATVACTGMIYQSLRTVHQWHNHLTVPNYLLLGLAGGGVWLNAVVAGLEINQPVVAGAAISAVIAAWLAKRAYWNFIDTTSHAATKGTATGLGALGEVSNFEAPHTEDNYLLKEMGYRIARKHAAKLRDYSEGLGFALPLALVAISYASEGGISVLAGLLGAISITTGLLIERWLFFAEAKHVVTLYYGADTA